ncbi:MAG: hypothetical protein ABIY70_18315 [Capsulimonas sp.]|uniref:hypothetical protein n=1 Tax=Capsulimonas sp. TaxID=2494211 RepID=UPI003264A1B4
MSILVPKQYDAYPTVDDVVKLIDTTNVLPDTDAWSAVGCIDWGAHLSEAIEEMETRTGRRFGVTSATARRFDLPANARGLIDLGDEICRIDSITVNGSAIAEDDDYVPGPANADAAGRPWRWIELFTFSNGGLVPRRPVTVTGLWGYSSKVPGDVYNAIRYKVAALVAPSLALYVSKGVISWKLGEEEERFASGKDGGPMATATAAWEARFDQVAASKRMTTV